MPKSCGVIDLYDNLLIYSLTGAVDGNIETAELILRHCKCLRHILLGCNIDRNENDILIINFFRDRLAL